MNRVLKRSLILIFIFGPLVIVSWHEVFCSVLTRDTLGKNLSSRTSDLAQISLAFVFDRTGSMYDDLVQVRAGAARILNSTIRSGETLVKSYILVPFRDPDVGPVFQTDDPEKFLKALNEIHVLGGEDCPEMSITAIKLALERSLPGSVVYVFTDAEAKDYSVLPEVIKLVKEKNVRVNFVLTGDCGLAPHDVLWNETYGTIATVSTGQILKLNKSEVNKIWTFVEISINSKRKSIFSGDKLTNGPYTYWVLVHPFIDQIIATASGEEVKLTIKDGGGQLVYPKDNGVEELFKLRSSVSVLIRRPKPGNWSFTVGSNGRHTLRVEGISNRWKKTNGKHTVLVVPDVDECATGTHTCEADEKCENIPNGHICIKTCSSGFQERRGLCSDIDECYQDPEVCGDLKCVNTLGSYNCESICALGFTRGDGTACLDINECLQNTNVCGDHQCINTHGSFYCKSACQVGFKRDKNDACADIDECSENSHVCGDRKCINTRGSYRCESWCPSGFKRQRTGICTDINECSQSQVCGDRQCSNTHGSYRCETSCASGFKRDIFGVCTDIDECSQTSQLCGDRQCINTRGSYRCGNRCPAGFKRDTTGVCADINECLDQPRRCQYSCENTIGSFQCLCPRGARLDTDKRTCIRIDNCPLRGYGKCQYKCAPSTGLCECPRGYRQHWDERSCLDINECLSGEQLCGSRECFNTLGKYHCLNVSCPQDYFLNSDGYCIKQCKYHIDQQCPGQYSSIRHTAVSIPCYLPLNTDFLILQPHIPQTLNIFQPLACYCSVHFYPVKDKRDLFGVYQVGNTGRLYNRVVFDQPGFHELHVVSDYLNGYGNIVGRTTHRVYVDVSDYSF